MVCIYCGKRTEVFNSRLQKRSNQVWRRRRCKSCKAVFTTLETPDLSSTLLVDDKGALKPFISDLLYTEVLLALSDRKDAYMAARELTNTVILQLLRLPSNPIYHPHQISKVTSGVLERFDKRAWHRYASEHPSVATS